MKKRIAVIMLSAVILSGVAVISGTGDESSRKGSAKPDAGLKQKKDRATGEKPARDNGIKGVPEYKLKKPVPPAPEKKDDKITAIPGDRLKNPAPAVSGSRREKFFGNMPVVVPDSTIDYKILVMIPDPNIDYKIKNVFPNSRVFPRNMPQSPPKSNPLPEPKRLQKTVPGK
jgi:hypothetical protein